VTGREQEEKQIMMVLVRDMKKYFMKMR